MQQAKRFCFYCLHKCWVALAICLVVLATVVSVLRIALPYADSYKHRVEQVLSQQLGADVAIGYIDAGWQGSGPALILQDVSIDGGEQLQLAIARTSLRLDFWQSLLSQQLTAEHVELNGLRYRVNADSLFTLNADATAPTHLALQTLEQLFFRQLKDFTVTASQLILYSDNNPDVVLDISKLNWRNDELRHQGHGELAIADVTANNVSFILDLHGPNLHDVQGKLYLQSSELDLLPLFRQGLPQASRLQKASINFRAWGDIEEGHLQQVQVALADNSVHWQREGEQHRLMLSPGQLLWQPTTQGWQLLSSELTLSSMQESWPGLQLQLQKDAQRLQFNLQHFQLDAVEPLAQLLAEDSNLVQGILQHQPSGYLETLQLSWQQQQWQLYGRFNDFSSEPVHDIPGARQLAGEIWAANEFVWLQVQGEQQHIAWADLFSDNWDYQQLQADIRFVKQQAHWQLQVPKFLLQATDFSVEAQGTLDLAEQTELALLLQVQGLDAAKASRYYPQRYMPEKTREYLTSAIEGGQLQQATLVWQGAFADFPFVEGQGQFQVLGFISDGRLQFDPHWPALTDLTATLLFDNASMLIEAQSGLLGLLPLRDPVTATIPDLFHAEQLDVRINTELNSEALTELMLQSSLEHSLGSALTHLGLSGPVRGDVLLEIDLHAPHVLASGYADLLGVQAQLQAPAMQLDNVTGRVHFKNEEIRGEALQFSWQGLAGGGSFNGAQDETQGYKVAIALDGSADALALTTALGAKAEGLLAGSMDWQLQLALALPQSGFNYQAALNARLDPLALHLPAPYQKDAGQAAALSVVAHGSTDQSYISAHYQDNLHFQAELPHSSGRIQRAQLTLGQDDLGLSSKGFNIDVELDEIALIPWLDFLQPLLSGSGEQGAMLPPLQRVRGKVATIQLPEQLRLTHTVFELEPTAQAWQLNLHGTELASRWQFFNDWHAKGMEVQLDYLHLPLAAKESISLENLNAELPELLAQNWLTQMVPVTVRCNDCSVGNYRFGKVNLQAAGQGEKWLLQQLTTDYKGSKFNIIGEWQSNDGIGVSQFNGTFVSPNIGALLTEYQLSSAISGSRSDINFQLNWAGAPQQFQLAALNGKVEFTLGDGSLTEVSDQGARLFSLFSLDSLVRKLRLDFRDVFSKGFFYNKMTGTLNLQQGVAHTNDVVIDGVPGNLSIQGYADLAKRQLDYQMSFAPKVTSSLPVIIAWMVNPVTGIAALALDEVFQSAEVISRINFTVTGSFEQPVVTEVNRHSTEVPVPVRVAQPEAVLNDNSQPQFY